MRSSLKGVPYTDGRRLPGAVLAQVSRSAKLSPVALVETGKKKRPVPQGPFCASTYVSIRSTCPDSCAFKDAGCYAQVGASRRIMKPLDEAGVGGFLAASNEAALIRCAFGAGQVPQDGARGGRDLRLHVGGDVSSRDSACELRWAAEDWLARGGGAVWTYTHRWREIPASAWGSIRVWASCESPVDVQHAHSRGYRAALVVERHPGDAMYGIGLPTNNTTPTIQVVPCPYETRGVTCVKCRLCLDAKLPMTTVIGFSAHGERRDDARRRLKVLNA